MPSVHVDNIKPNEEILIGSRGNRYVVRKERKYYITDQKYIPNRRYKPRNGAYNRFTECQMNAVTGNTKVGHTRRRKRDHRNGEGVSTQERQEHGDGLKVAQVSDQQQALVSIRDGQHVRGDHHHQGDQPSAA